MRNERRSLIIVFFYVIVMLLMCLFTVTAIQKTSNKNISPGSDDTAKNQDTNKIYVPVYVGSTPSDSETNAETETGYDEMSFLVKSYKGKIGIFSNNGELIQIIDVYTKTLPIADREMLEEGITINNVDELRDIIEDYTG